jgi:8-oxo-dGTP diphosphatase
MSSRKLMVVGFLLSEDLRFVLLLRKARPEWQVGRLNGVGGHKEDVDTTFESTMRREFLEETGVQVDDWAAMGEMGGDDWFVVAFCAKAPIEVLKKAVQNTKDKDERAEIWPSTIHTRSQVVGNVAWLVPMAVDFLDNPETFRRMIIEYGK